MKTINANVRAAREGAAPQPQESGPMRTLLLAGCLLTLAAVQAGAQCLGDFNGDGKVTVDELVTAVDNALNGCQVSGQRFVDNGDGTITDRQARLMWEKLSRDGTIHDYENSYTWYTAATTKIAALNSDSFAGRTDWRLPNVNELQTLVNFGAVNPAVDALFNTNCIAYCIVASCSCTWSQFYWSSTTYRGVPSNAPSNAWLVDFFNGVVDFDDASSSYSVRAVRGGS